MVDLWRSYVQMATGLGELTAARARDVARAVAARAQANGSMQGLLPGAPAVAGSVAAIAEDLLAGARANRGLLLDLVRGEVERAVAGMGLVTPTDLVRLERRVSALERGVTTASTPTKRAARTSPTKSPTKSPTRSVATKKATTKKATTKKATTKKAATKAAPRAATRSTRAGRG